MRHGRMYGGWLLGLAALLGGSGLARCRDVPASGRAGAAPAASVPVLDLRSAVTRYGDSLRVAVGWQLDSAVVRPADSILVRAGITGDIGGGRIRAPRTVADTFYLPVPAPGGTTQGYACVNVGTAAGAVDTCTPWQFVRPAVAPRATPAGSGERPVRLVVRPDGLQVDPDVGGRCAAWRREHPDAPVWLEVNERAVPACTGPNGRPTVAQFCAFAILPDGRRMKTASASNVPYCEREYRRWLGERAS